MGAGEPKKASENSDINALAVSIKDVENSDESAEPPTEDNIATAGKLVFDTLFPKQVGADFAAAYDETERERKGLRILLNVAPEFSGDGYPWEIARYKDKYLATYIRTPFLRIYPGLTMGIPLAEGKMPRVLSILSNVESKYAVDVGKEYENLDKAITSNRNFGGYVDIKPQGTSSSNPSLLDITQVLNSTKTDFKVASFNIIHFLAHGRENGKENMIILQPTDDEKRGGKSEIEVTGKNLVELFKDENDIGLIIINACSSGQLFSTSKGLVQELLSSVPAIVAMRKAIGKDTAKDFTSFFYQNLTPHNVEAALQLTRGQLQQKNKTNIDFSIPIIYLGYNQATETANTRIFTSTQTAIKQWEPVANLSPHALTVLRLIKLHDDSVTTEHNWTEKTEEEKQCLTDAKVVKMLIFSGFKNSLDRFSKEIGACSTFPNAKSIWLSLCKSLDNDMTNFSECLVERDETKVQVAFDEFKQDYEALEKLVARIATSRKEEAV